MTTILFAHDVRHWTTFEVTNLSVDERAVLEQSDAQSVELMSKLHARGRLTFLSESTDDKPELFDPMVDPSVIELWDEEES